MSPRPRALLTAALLAATLGAAGCGSGGDSAAGLRQDARRACTAAAVHLRAIGTPQMPDQGGPFLRQGVAALGPELAALRRLRPQADLAATYGRARQAGARELALLKATVKDLKSGDDPVVAFKTLQHHLAPVEREARAAWASLEVPACGDL